MGLYRRVDLWVLPILIAVGGLYVAAIPWLTLPETYRDSHVPGTFFLAHWPSFAVGMAIAVTVQRWRAAAERWPVGLAFTTLFLCSYVVWAGRWLPEIPRWAATLYVAWLVLTLFGAAIFGPTVVRRVFDNRLCTKLAVISFTVYLIHQPTMWYLREACLKLAGLSFEQTLGVLLGIGLPVTLGLSAVLWFVWERPVDAWAQAVGAAGLRPRQSESTRLAGGAR